MIERQGLVTLHGNPLTLTGNPVAVGDAAPDAELIDNNLKPFSMASLAGKVRVIAAVPSLDTPVCDLQTRRFNTEAANLGGDVTIVTVSMDLPFAQKRWCGAAGIDRLTTVSDHKNAGFGLAYGVLIKELRLLARAVFVVDRHDVVRHAQIVQEVGAQPDYEAVLAAVKEALT
jgi:thiol peroxidase